jgi:hypothetical protein
MKPSDVKYEGVLKEAYTRSREHYHSHVNRDQYAGWRAFSDGLKVGLAIAHEETRWRKIKDEEPEERRLVLIRWRAPGSAGYVGHAIGIAEWLGHVWSNQSMQGWPGNPNHEEANTEWRYVEDGTVRAQNGTLSSVFGAPPLPVTVPVTAPPPKLKKAYKIAKAKAA